MADQTFFRFMAHRNGTGIGAHADETGNNKLSNQLIDHYAQAGQVIPQNIQGALRELNEITQREATLDGATPSARAALTSGGYDPLAVKKRYAELENMILSESADARNLKERIEIQTAQGQLELLEDQTRMNTATFDARKDNKLAQLTLDTLGRREQIDAAERGREIEGLLQSAFEKGFGTTEMQEAWHSASADRMQEVFGTTDRALAHEALRAALLGEDELASSMIENMSTAASLQAAQLDADPEMTDEMLQRFLADPDAARAAGVTGTAAAAALEGRTLRVQATDAYMQARQQGITSAEVLQETTLGSMAPHSKAQVLADILGGEMDMNQIKEHLEQGQIDTVLDAVMAKGTVGKDGKIALPGPDGLPVEVSVVDLVNGLAMDEMDGQRRTAFATLANQELERFIGEQQETQRVIDFAQALVGRPLSNEARRAVEIAQDQAHSMIRASMRAESTEDFQALREGAVRAMENGRRAVVEDLRRTGTPEHKLESITQGRFANHETIRDARRHLLAGQEYATRGGMFGPGLAALIQEKGWSKSMLDEWLATPEADIYSIGRSEGWIRSGTQITEGDIVGVVEGPALSVLSSELLEEMQGMESLQLLPESVQETIAGLAQSVGDGEKSGPAAVQSTLQAIRAADEAMWAAEQAASMEANLRGEKFTPSYQRGQLASQLDDLFRRKDITERIFRDVNSMEQMALLNEYLYIHLPDTTRFGDQSLQFDDIPAAAASVLMEKVTGGIGSIGGSDLVSMRSHIEREAAAFAGVGGGAVTKRMRTPEENLVHKQVSAALFSIYARKSAGPEEHRSDIFGWRPRGVGESFIGSGVPSAGGQRGPAQFATMDEVREEMQRMGYDPAVLDR